MTEIIGKGRYEVAENQQFVDREGNLVRVIKDSTRPIRVGEAYAAFDCRASKNAIESEMGFIRRLVMTPEELELHFEATNSPRGNTKLKQLANEARQEGLGYLIEGNYPTATNARTADELAAVLNQAYQSPLYQTGEEFRGNIIYKEKGQYVFRE